MSQPLTRLLVQLIFSTKNHISMITLLKLNPDLFAYMGGILKNYDSRLLGAGGTSDHVHPAGLAIKVHRPERVAERSKEKQFPMDQDCGKKDLEISIGRMVTELFQLANATCPH